MSIIWAAMIIIWKRSSPSAPGKTTLRNWGRNLLRYQTLQRLKTDCLPWRARRRDKEEQTRIRRLEKEQKRLEEIIAETEAKIEWIQNEMCREEVYSDHVTVASHQSDLNDLELLLSETYEAWIALQEQN